MGVYDGSFEVCFCKIFLREFALHMANELEVVVPPFCPHGKRCTPIKRRHSRIVEVNVCFLQPEYRLHALELHGIA